MGKNIYWVMLTSGLACKNKSSQNSTSKRQLSKSIV